MGFWPARAARDVADTRSAIVAAAETFPSSSNVYQITTGIPVDVHGVTAPTVDRRTAMSVPAVARGATLLVTTMAGLPLERIDAAGVRQPLGWIEQPERGRPRFATFCDLGYDLLFDGRAYLKVRDRDSTKAPRLGGCEYIALNRIGDLTDPVYGPTITIDGVVQNPADVIGFSGWHDGILHHGARIIRTALALEAAARRYADAPRPSERLKNTSGYDLDDAEIDALLADYKAARNAEGVAYVNAGLDVVEVGWNAAQMQLVEARQFTATQIANLVGVPAHHIAGAAAAAGGSMTYTNVGMENRGLIDYGVKSLTSSIESRLSMTDVTGEAWSTQVTARGTSIRFNIDGLLRGNPLERAQVYAVLIPLGVLTVEEARAIEDLAPTGRNTQ